MKHSSECRMAISVEFDDRNPAAWTFDDQDHHHTILQKASFADIADGFRVPCYPYGNGVQVVVVPYTDVEMPKARRQYLGVPVVGYPKTTSMELTLKLYLECGELDLTTTGYEVLYARRHLWFLTGVEGIGSLDGLVYYDTLSWSESIICRAEGER